MKKSFTVRNLVVILGDQLDLQSNALTGFDPSMDAVWMAEVSEESTHVWSHKARIAIFLSAMRHFRKALEEKGFKVIYYKLDDKSTKNSLSEQLKSTCKNFKPQKIFFTEPGEWRLRESLLKTAEELGIEQQIHSDRLFLCTHEEFVEYAKGRKQLRLEYFYRDMRKKHDVLMNASKPVGGQWNFDQDNRQTFGKEGPQNLLKPYHFKPDEITQEVIDLVKHKFKTHPGSLDHFDWPVTHKQAKQALNHFIKHTLPHFGNYQDALWTGEPFLFHSRLSTALNLKLLDPLEVIHAAEKTYHDGDAPLNAVEGFIRQILGWREYVRGVYWLLMPNYLERNYLQANEDLPGFYWNGETDCFCLKETITQTLKFGYAHHIQRLMITGLFALLYGVHPRQVHEWYLAVYVDAVEWVELPNTLGMSQFADGEVMASKPYAASGKYIQRMSNYCSHCRFNPAEAIGENACPFTTLYWDFLARHRKTLHKNRRMQMQLKNLDRKSGLEVKAIRNQAEQLRKWVRKDT